MFSWIVSSEYRNSLAWGAAKVGSWGLVFCKENKKNILTPTSTHKEANDYRLYKSYDFWTGRKKRITRLTINCMLKGYILYPILCLIGKVIFCFFLFILKYFHGIWKRLHPSFCSDDIWKYMSIKLFFVFLLFLKKITISKLEKKF